MKNNSRAVVATVTRKADLEFLEAETTQPSALSFEVLEFRLDDLCAEAPDRIAKIQQDWRSTHQILSTARHPAEGGQNDLDEQTRADLLLQSLDHSTYIDIENQTLSGSAFGEVIAEAQASSVQVVGSFHNFNHCPSPAELADQVEQSFASGADIAKLAVVIETHAELFSLVELVEATRAAGKRISAMGMGPLGKMSRLILAGAGSELNYGFLHEPNAPGQWPAIQLRELIDQLTCE